MLLFAVVVAYAFLRPLFPSLQAQRSIPSESNAKMAIEELRTSAEFSKNLAAAALARAGKSVDYDPGYYEISYPGGDVPEGKGVCADLVVRAYRSLGVDLQRLVHEDMKDHFRLYPQAWEMRGPDHNIDHRRVPNLQRYFARFGNELKATRAVDDYQVGDVVAWRLSQGGRRVTGSHIGIVVPGPGAKSHEKWVVHNIGAGPKWEDDLFRYEIVGHYRFTPRPEGITASAESETDASATTSAN